MVNEPKCQALYLEARLIRCQFVCLLSSSLQNFNSLPLSTRLHLKKVSRPVLVGLSLSFEPLSPTVTPHLTILTLIWKQTVLSNKPYYFATLWLCMCWEEQWKSKNCINGHSVGFRVESWVTRQIVYALSLLFLTCKIGIIIIFYWWCCVLCMRCMQCT